MVFEEILGYLLSTMKTIFRKIGNMGLILFVLSVSVSCVSTKSFIIEIPQKGKKELPGNIQSLLIVSRVVDDTFNDLDSDTLQRLFYKQNFDYDTVIRDIQSVDTLLKATGDLLFESGRYDIVIPENRFLPFEKNSFLAFEMPWNEVNELCEIYNTDAVLSLDHFKTRVMTSYEKDSYYSPVDGQFYSYSAADIKVAFEALFRVYDPTLNKVVLREIMRDTIFWDDVGPTAAILFDHFTPVKQALTETGIAIALDFSEMISTIWRQERRNIFYKGDSELKQATELVDADEWEQAVALWKKIAESSNSKSIKSKAEYNLAVGYEIQGNIDDAISWALKSYETMFRTNTYTYLEILKYRKNELNKQ